VRLHQHHVAGGVVFIEPARIVFGSGSVSWQRIPDRSSRLENPSVQKVGNELKI
jgi:hypothetical protein